MVFGGLKETRSPGVRVIPRAQQRDQVPRALKARGNTPKYGLTFHSTFVGRAAAKNKGCISWQTNAVLPHESTASLRCPPVFWGRSFENKLRSGCPSMRLERFLERIWMSWKTQWFRQRKRLLRLLGSSRNRRRNAWRRLAAISLASSENSSAPEECEETSERPKKKKKQKPQEAPLEKGMEDPSVSFSKPRKRNLFPRKSALVVI